MPKVITKISSYLNIFHSVLIKNIFFKQLQFTFNCVKIIGENMDGKVILKSALITIGALIVAVALSFTLWFFLAPRSMASISQQWGYYDFALTCANSQYKKSKKTDDLAFCAEISIYLADDYKIVKYCEPLTGKDDFEELCNKKDEKLSKTQYGVYASDYRSYILGNLAVSEYRLGDLKKAVNTAELGDVDCFKRLILEVVLHGTEEDKENLKTYPADPEIRDYIGEMIKLLTQEQ